MPVPRRGDLPPHGPARRACTATSVTPAPSPMPRAAPFLLWRRAQRRRAPLAQPHPGAQKRMPHIRRNRAFAPQNIPSMGLLQPTNLTLIRQTCQIIDTNPRPLSRGHFFARSYETSNSYTPLPAGNSESSSTPPLLSYRTSSRLSMSHLHTAQPCRAQCARLLPASSPPRFLQRRVAGGASRLAPWRPCKGRARRNRRPPCPIAPAATRLKRVPAARPNATPGAARDQVPPRPAIRHPRPGSSHDGPVRSPGKQRPRRSREPPARR